MPAPDPRQPRPGTLRLWWWAFIVRPCLWFVVRPWNWPVPIIIVIAVAGALFGTTGSVVASVSAVGVVLIFAAVIYARAIQADYGSDQPRPSSSSAGPDEKA